MNIGFDAKRFFFNKTGLGNYSRNIVNYLTKNYPENQYFLFSPKKSNKKLYTDNQQIKIITPKHKFNSIWRSFTIKRNPVFKKLDIYHGLSNELPFGISKTNVKSIVTIHDLIFMKFPELYKPIDRKIYTYKALKACTEADKIIAISRQTKNDIIKLLNITEKKIEIVHQGCAEIFLKTADDNQIKLVKDKYNLPKNYILNVGTIEKRKNILTVIKAVNKAKIDFPLVIVGRATEYQNEIENYIAENKMHNILIISNVSFQDLPAIYQSADIFIYPSFYEGFGIPLIEAFNSKIPVIASDIDVFREVAENAAVFVNPHNIDDISEKLKSLIENPQLRQKYINRGLKRSLNFTDKKIADDLTKIYNRL